MDTPAKPAAKRLRRVHPALRDDIGDLRTRRPLPGPAVEQVDPFLFLNHHGPQVYAPGNGGLPFGPHPHRGFETVTFILEGELAHRDSGGHESVIRAGGVQWMTAGRGLVHAEVSPEAFKRSGGPLEILQLWVNLPSRLKMSAPRYTGVQREDIPALRCGDGGRGTLNLIAGDWPGADARPTRGPVESLTGVFMSTLQLPAGERLQVPGGLAGRNVFLYLVRGAVAVGDDDDAAPLPEHALAELSDEGDALAISARADSVLLFGHAAPLGEPVVAHGPFVMNTVAEIRQAIADYQAGQFGGLAG